MMNHRVNHHTDESHPLSTFNRTLEIPRPINDTNKSLFDSPWRKPSPYQSGTSNKINDNDESERFLPPVKLDPGWEGMDHSSEELNILERNLEQLKKEQPPDHWNLVYIIMILHGIGMLMPWNMFITAKSYFEDYKLNKGNASSPELLDYKTNFMSYLGMASQFPTALMGFINLFFHCGGNIGNRIICSIAVMVVVFIVTVALAMIDTSAWPETFFWVTLGTAVILNSASGVYQNSMYGVAALLPMKYTNAVIFGSNLSGTFVACVNILSLVLAPDIKTSAIYYFVTAIVILLIAFDGYFILPLTKFFNHFKHITKLKARQHQQHKTETCGTMMKKYLLVFKQIWVLALSVWLVFFVSLALFPQILSDVKRLSLPIEDTYWAPVFCFLNFNLFAMLGNLVSQWVKKPGPRYVWIPIIIRVGLIPLLLLCNFRPDDRAWPILIGNDYVFIAASITLALTGGYFSSLCMMYAPKKVEIHHAGTAGMMMALFLILGILCGVNASRGLAALVKVTI